MPSAIPINQLGAIILCGGSSTRMGFAKSQLPLGDGKSFLDQIILALRPKVSTIVVVQNVEEKKQSASDIFYIHDRKTGYGPMEGIASGLQAMPAHIQAAFVTSCDVPLIRAEVVECLASELGKHDAVTPYQGDRIYGLTAIYRTSILAKLDELIDEQILKVADIRKYVDVRQIPVDQLREVDPNLASLTNINSADDYRALAQELGFQVPAEIESRLQ